MQPSPGLYGSLREALDSSWVRTARPNQLPPTGDWNVWLVMAGRGFGKTLTGAHWVNGLATAGQVGRIGLIAPTAADARDVMVEGPTGIMAVAPNYARPVYEPSKRRVTWPNGALATLFTSEEPERLRGPQHGAVWGDELGAWVNPQECWDQMQFGLRLGRKPRVCVTTTPKPIKLIRSLLAREGRDVVVTRGATRDNAANLPAEQLAELMERYAGTRLGRQELEGEFLDDVPGALWLRAWIDDDRTAIVPDCRRIIVAVDPAVSNKEGSDETGIVVAGEGPDEHLYVIEDLTGRYAPHDWARQAVAAYHRHRADRIVAEVNNGGQLVENTIRMVDARVSYKQVHATRGKAIRAEPISALYEQHKVHHVGIFSKLEDQMCSFTSDFDRSRAGYSPDRVDALVWALTELSEQQSRPARWRTLRVMGR